MYKIGQRVCLWEEKILPYRVLVTKEIMVTITEIKVGVPLANTGVPTSNIGLKGVDDSGNQYEKHWNVWPIDDNNVCNGGVHFWTKVTSDSVVEQLNEAVHAYNELRICNHMSVMDRDRVDSNAQPILPKGEVAYCSAHDEYFYNRGSCALCQVRKVA